MAIKSKTYAVIGSIVSGGGFVILVLSFASDSWIAASDFKNTGFSNLGLWSVCFDGKYRPPPFAAISREYEGCWWSLNKELDDMRSFLFPKWFVSTQALVTTSLVLGIFVVIMLVVNFINCFPYSPYKHKIKRGIALTSSLFLFVAGVLLCIAVILFGVRATSTRTWLQDPDNNYLSWSYGMCIMAAFLFIIAAMCIYLQFLRLRGEKDDPDDGEPKVMLTSEPPPTTNYRYTPGRNPNFSEAPQSREPAYVQRYANNQSSRPPPRGPDSLFAVSGAGEVYVNRMTEYEDRYKDDFRDGYRERGRNGVAPWHQKKPVEVKKPKEELDVSVDGTYTGSDYEKSKRMDHATLPEYTPKSARKSKQSKAEAATDSDTLDSIDKDDKKKKSADDGGKSKRKSRSDSKKKRSGSRDRSRSGSRSRKKNRSDSEYSESESTKKRSRRRSKSRDRDDSEEDRSRSRRRSKKRSSSKTRHKSRSKSRDLDSTYSDTQFDSDSGSVRSRSKRRHDRKHSSREDVSRKDKKHQSDRTHRSKSRDGNISDDKLGSEYSQRRSGRKGGRFSDNDTKKRLRDFSETESVRSNKSRHKPKGTSYSSYYE